MEQELIPDRTMQTQFDLETVEDTAQEKQTILKDGETAWAGNWQIRNFQGYRQSREGGAGPWKFHVSSFDSTSTGQSGFCNLVMMNGAGTERVPIDAQDRLTVNGKKYGHSHWCH